LAAGLALALLVVNAGYGFRGSLTPLGRYNFHSEALSGEPLVDGAYGPGNNRLRGSLLGRLPVPLPRDYVRGLDLQKSEFEDRLVSYLRGEWREGGWWYYYLYGLAVKVPVGTLALAALAVLGAKKRPLDRRAFVEHACLLGPPAAVLVLVSSQTGINLFLRYALPALPFLAVALGAAFSPSRPSWQVILAGGLLAWSTASSLVVFPHSISYFNELVGGPKQGARHLLDGNIGWGQDLLFLRRWYDRHPEARPLGLVYFGNLDARVAGIDFFLPPRGPMSANRRCAEADARQGPWPGWYAVDVSFVHGLERQVLDGRGEWLASPLGCDYSYFRRFEPVDRIGYSMNIYHLSLAQANAVRRQLGLRELEGEPRSR
jgi:hypothetical protein